MDLLVGLWAERHLPNMPTEQLAAMEAVLDQENPDLFKWLTGQEEPPETMKANPAFTVRLDFIVMTASLCRYLCMPSSSTTLDGFGHTLTKAPKAYKTLLESTSSQSLVVA